MFNLYLTNTLLASVLGMSLVAMQFSLLNNPQIEIEDFIRLSFYRRYGGDILSDKQASTYFSFLTSIFFAGCMVGTLCFGGYAANKYGRQRSLMFVQTPLILGSAMAGSSQFTDSYELFLIGRALAGIGAGCIVVIMPLYISEIAPPSCRGIGGMLVPFAMAFGATIVLGLGQYDLLGNDDNWPLLILLMILPSCLFLVLFSFAPESPRYLIITQHQLDQGKYVLKKLFGDNTELVEREIANMEAEKLEIENAPRANKTSILQILKDKHLRLPLFVCICVTWSQSISGFPIMVIYSTKLFQKSGLGLIVSKHATLAWSIFNLFLPPLFGYLVERFGRRKLLLVSLLMTIMTMLLMTAVLTIAHSGKYIYGQITIDFT